MKYKEIQKATQNVAKKIGREVNLMELCGTHTFAVASNGIKDLLPANVKLKSGPGCPVCATDQLDIDIIVHLAKSGVPIATYGDVLRVPGSGASLSEARAEGAEVMEVYSVHEAVEESEKRRENNKSPLVFFGLGFETTAPASAWAVKKGLTVYSAHKCFVPAMAVLLKNREIKIDGFINPGHVSAIIGLDAYRQFDFPQVVSGFEAEDVLESILMLLNQIAEGRAVVENQYTRIVGNRGNRKACALLEEVFEKGPALWRGLGLIRQSGMDIREKYRRHDAKTIYWPIISKYLKTRKEKKTGCRCGEVLQGKISPQDCPLFGKACVPGHPQGACMVSVEGACAIEYKHKK